MKKIITVLLVLLLLCACKENTRKEEDTNKTYNDMIELIKSQEKFLDYSEYFNIETELTKISDGYRFYVAIDSPKIAMYDIEALAIENDVDYSKNMAASVGVFENEQYNMIPNQSNVKEGYVKGLVISGTSKKSETTLYLLVSFKNKDLPISNNQYVKLNLKYNEDHVDVGALNG